MIYLMYSIVFYYKWLLYAQIYKFKLLWNVGLSEGIFCNRKIKHFVPKIFEISDYGAWERGLMDSS